jgi:multicomponent Na+:H+ antiporter subunit G
MTAAGIISLILAASGFAVMLISLAGLISFPDFFTRLHVQGVGDTLGALLIILGMMVATGAHLLSVKLFFVFVLIMLTNPVGTNLMMIAAIYYQDYQAYSRVRPGKAPDSSESESESEVDAEPESEVDAEPESESDADKGKADKSSKPSKPVRPSMKKTRAELIDIAESMGISVPENATKKSILEMIYNKSPELKPKTSAKTSSKKSSKSSSKGASAKSSSSKRASTKSSSTKNPSSGGKTGRSRQSGKARKQSGGSGKNKTKS